VGFPRGEFNVSPAAEEFYTAAARLVAAIRAAFPHPLNPVQCPDFPGDQDCELPEGKASTWRSFAVGDEFLHPVHHHLIRLVPGLWGVRRSMYQAATLVRNKPVVGSGRAVFRQLLIDLFEPPWLSVVAAPPYRTLWLLPPSAEVADQMRVAARDLDFYPAPTGESDTSAQLAGLGEIVPEHVVAYRRLNAAYLAEEVYDHSRRAADEVNQQFGLLWTPSQYRTEHNRWKKREETGWKPAKPASKPHR
jgi:hypothetical protein